MMSNRAETHHAQQGPMAGLGNTLPARNPGGAMTAGASGMSAGVSSGVSARVSAAGMVLPPGVRALLGRLGVAGSVGLLMLLAAVGLIRGALEPIEVQREALVSELATVRGSAARSRAAQPASEAPGDRVAAFYAFFAQGGRATDELVKLHVIAEKLNLKLASADYKLADRRAGPLESYSVAIPIAGSYAQVRAFAANVLEAVPVAALDRIEFKRRPNDPNTVDAMLEFTFFLARL